MSPWPTALPHTEEVHVDRGPVFQHVQVGECECMSVTHTDLLGLLLQEVALPISHSPSENKSNIF